MGAMGAPDSNDPESTTKRLEQKDEQVKALLSSLECLDTFSAREVGLWMRGSTGLVTCKSTQQTVPNVVQGKVYRKMPWLELKKFAAD